ncbi:hypothetical protein HZF02_04870 [Pseudomonas yamanorum]|nr:hypothetical protein HZF02_04870 [Pseudomonas yamanorum]
MNSLKLKLLLSKNYTEAHTPPLTQLVDAHWSKLIAAIETAQTTPGQVVKLILPYGVELHFIFSDTPDSSGQSWAAKLFEQIINQSQIKAEEHSAAQKTTRKSKMPLC